MADSGSVGEFAVDEGPPDEKQTAPILAQINPAGLSDVPSERDGIGFRPYVRAIAWFLSNEKTKPPLTMSIEGPWGSGKSSFMLQLQKELSLRTRLRSSNTIFGLMLGEATKMKLCGLLSPLRLSNNWMQKFISSGA